MTLRVDQLKNISIPLNYSWVKSFNHCAPTVSMYDILNSYFASNSFTFYTDKTLSGNGTLSSPLKIASQSATSGQVLTWDGSSWTPQNPSIGVLVQTLSLVDDDITLSDGGGSIPVGDLISSNAPNDLTVGSDGKLRVLPSSSLPSADTAGQIVYWTGASWAVALEYTNEQSPTSGNQIFLPHTPISSLPTRVFLNGLLKRKTVDYNIGGSTITFMYNFAPNDKITTTYFN